MTATTPGSLPLVGGQGSANAVYALLADAYEDGTLIDVLNDHTAEAREAGYQQGWNDHEDKIDEETIAAYGRGYGHGYDEALKSAHGSRTTSQHD